MDRCRRFWFENTARAGPILHERRRERCAEFHESLTMFSNECALLAGLLTGYSHRAHFELINAREIIPPRVHAFKYILT